MFKKLAIQAHGALITAEEIGVGLGSNPAGDDPRVIIWRFVFAPLDDRQKVVSVQSLPIEETVDDEFLLMWGTIQTEEARKSFLDDGGYSKYL